MKMTWPRNVSEWTAETHLAGLMAMPFESTEDGTNIFDVLFRACQRDKDDCQIHREIVEVWKRVLVRNGDVVKSTVVP